MHEYETVRSHVSDGIRTSATAEEIEAAWDETSMDVAQNLQRADPLLRGTFNVEMGCVVRRQFRAYLATHAESWTEQRGWLASSFTIEATVPNAVLIHRYVARYARR